MKEEINSDFVSLLQDEAFLRMVQESNGLENQLEILEREYPGQHKTIAFAMEFLRTNLSDQKQMSSEDETGIWQNINQHLGQKASISSNRLVGFKIWKVAAALIIIFASSVLTYQFLRSHDALEKIAGTKTKVGDEAMIILSDGSKHKLGVKDSQIEYRSDGGEVVVKNGEQEKKIENVTNSKASDINQIIVPYGHRHTLTLSDGTRVQLNSGSRLVFPAEFSDSKREVYLKGEGYFEVTKNPNRPFVVKTDFIDIKVLGTVFNISAYEDEKMSTAVLVEGKVLVSQKNKLFGYTDKKLEPGQGCFYSLTSFSSDIRNVDVNEHVSWKDGISLFKDKPLINVVDRIERYYDKRVSIEGEKLANTLISGKLVLSENFDEVIQYLVKTVEGRSVKNEDGSYSIKDTHN